MNIINSLTGNPLNNVKLEDVVKYNKIKTAYENILKDEYIKLPYSVELLCAINKMLNEDLIYLNDYNLNDVENEIGNNDVTADNNESSSNQNGNGGFYEDDGTKSFEDVQPIR